VHLARDELSTASLIAVMGSWAPQQVTFEQLRVDSRSRSTTSPALGALAWPTEIDRPW
jgi:hypothetical protein